MFPALVIKRADRPNVAQIAAFVDRMLVEWNAKFEHRAMVSRNVQRCVQGTACCCVRSTCWNRTEWALGAKALGACPALRVYRGEGGSNLWKQFVEDRAPLTREFPTNSGVGVSAPKGIKKTVPKDGEGDDGMRLLSDVGLVAAGGLIWNPHNDQPLIQRGKQIQFAEVIPRF